MKALRNYKWIGFFLLCCISFTVFQGNLQAQVQEAAKVPQKVYRIAGYIERNGRPMDGYIGGRIFQNREKLLPAKDSYREYDVNRKVKGKNRGAERLILSARGSRYYTADHYRNFVKF
ncbi:ribonuclease domain-containing protein [Pedobacter antarcticus]|uniref:ribonuclease domain-containing protein n=1 Tax=Pedobacter antarcticus TaxID=34086 RepID=UPI001C565EB2|nr:ribonuclease domain-containing protein [Pedobacter antarcticus]